MRDVSGMQQPAVGGSSATGLSIGGDAASAVGRRRRLRRLGGAGGVVSGIAIDHRDSMRLMLERQGGEDPGIDTLRSLKLALTRALAPTATVIMLDEELGGLALEVGAVPPSVALIMPLEAQGYETAAAGRVTTLLDDFSPGIALRYAADACKLLLPYRIDEPEAAALQEALVTSTAAACHAVGLPLVVEPVAYKRPDETIDAFGRAYSGLVVGSIERLRPLGVDLLKLPFPILELAATGDAAALDACRAVDRACRDTPWVLLGAGADTELFVEQIRLAGTAGASGFLAGRGIWGAAVAAYRDESEVARTAATVCLPALERCREAAERFAQPIGRTRAH